MKGLGIPPEVVESLGGGKRPAVTMTLNGHVWRSRVAVMRGRHLIGLSKPNRQAAGVETGDDVEVALDQRRVRSTAPAIARYPAGFGCRWSPLSYPGCR